MINLSYQSEGVVVLSFDAYDSKVNTLTMDCMNQLSEYLDEIRSKVDSKVLIITSGKPGIFIAGADIKEIQSIQDTEEAVKLVSQGQHVLDKLDAMPIPTIAMIDGVCLGGGLELALACDYRMASLSSKTQLGLPEVNLGIIPGFGGTQRLPRLIGVRRALSMILSGKAVNGKKAFKLGLVDRCYHSSFMESALSSFLEDIKFPSRAHNIRSKRKNSMLSRFFEWSVLGRFVIKFTALRQLRKRTFGKYPAPENALKAVLSGYTKKLKKGLGLEAILFSMCLNTSVASYLMKLFFVQEQQKKIVVQGSKPALIKQAAVVGSGLMGSGIAWSLLYRTIPTVVKDVSTAQLVKAVGVIKGIFSELKKKRRITTKDIDLYMHGLALSTEYDILRHADIVVEAVPEQVDLKTQVYSDIERVISKECVLATNTSSLSIDELAHNVAHPGRFVGMHFFSPVNRMPLVEIIPSEKTTNKTLSTVIELVKRMKKMPVVVKNCPGFLVNRVFLPYVNEAMHCLLDGASIQNVDCALHSFGMPLGPLSVADNVGLDVGIHVLNVLEKGYGERMAVSQFALSVLNEKKWLGKKTGKGFYLYNDKNKKHVHADMVDMLKSFRSSNTEVPKEQDIVDRCIFIMLNEAARCLEEGIVENASQLDFAMIMGVGFPPFLGGLCAYADKVGLNNVIERLHYFSRVYGKRFEPSPYLMRLSKEKGSFFVKEDKNA